MVSLVALLACGSLPPVFEWRAEEREAAAFLEALAASSLQVEGCARELAGVVCLVEGPPRAVEAFVDDVGGRWSEPDDGYSHACAHRTDFRGAKVGTPHSSNFVFAPGVRTVDVPGGGRIRELFVDPDGTTACVVVSP